MTAKVMYLHSWPNCPDDILRRNYALQTRITEARIHFFYKLDQDMVPENIAKFRYSMWVQNNRGKLKLVKPEES